MGGRPIYTVGPGVPQVGTLAFGVVDRGTNVLEVRPTSVCALSCVFCSVNAGPQSRARWAEYVVEAEALLSALEEVVRFKKTDDVEVHIDGMGDPGAYPQLVELVEGAKAMRGVAVVSMQTRLYMLDEGRIRRLAEAGLDRFNVSIDALDPALARKLAGAGWYNVERVLQLVKTALEAGINVVISPVWVPSLNDEEMPKIAKWAVENGVGRGGGGLHAGAYPEVHPAQEGPPRQRAANELGRVLEPPEKDGEGARSPPHTEAGRIQHPQGAGASETP